MARLARLLATVLAVTAAMAVALVVARWGLSIADPPGASTTGAGGSATAVAGGSATVPHGVGWQAWGARPDGSPLRWDPCRTVTWAVRPQDPTWLVELATEAFDRVGAETGLEFSHVGRHELGVGADQRTAVRGDWAPVLVTLTSAEETEWLTADDRALAVPVVVNGVFVTGQVLLDADAELATDFSSRDGSWGATLLHEAGHLTGLDHVDDPAQLLYPYPLPGPVEFGPGDQRGFDALAADPGCLDAGPVADLGVQTPRRR